MSSIPQIFPASGEIPGVFAAKQKRSMRIRDAYIKAGVELLNSTRFQDLKVSDLAVHAGCSVGSFYTRFKDKEVFFLLLRSAAIESCNVIIRDRVAPERLAQLSPSVALDEMVDLMGDLFTGPWRGVLRESLLRILEPDDPWAPMRESARTIIQCYDATMSTRFEHFDAEESRVRLRFCFQLTVGALQNDLVNDYHVFSTRDQSLREGLKEAVRGYMRLPTDA
jgi:AcrR family transcriptional regulator